MVITSSILLAETIYKAVGKIKNVYASLTKCLEDDIVLQTLVSSKREEQIIPKYPTYFPPF